MVNTSFRSTASASLKVNTRESKRSSCFAEIANGLGVNERYVVSPWMHFGDAITYVKKYPDVDRRKLVCSLAI